MLSLRAKRGSPTPRTSKMDGHAALAMTHFLSLRAKRGSPSPRTAKMDGCAALAMTHFLSLHHHFKPLSFIVKESYVHVI